MVTVTSQNELSCMIYSNSIEKRKNWRYEAHVIIIIIVIIIIVVIIIIIVVVVIIIIVTIIIMIIIIILILITIIIYIYTYVNKYIYILSYIYISSTFWGGYRKSIRNGSITGPLSGPLPIRGPYRTSPSSLRHHSLTKGYLGYAATRLNR